ncbi:MAG: hypothetical protein IRY99_22340, partial [Isosphaeraceae bacterium]|nr:hypothetical protein [Isosphaeraceae bacterium]
AIYIPATSSLHIDPDLAEGPALTTADDSRWLIRFGIVAFLLGLVAIVLLSLLL